MEKNDRMTHLSRNLRKNATKEENTLWYQYLRHYPVQFRRQFPFGMYIVDFYCAKAMLVIELDGSQHYEPAGIMMDAERTRYLESLGLKVLRFSNADINQRLESVCQMVDLTVKERILSASIPDGTGRKAHTEGKNQGVFAPHPPLRGHLPPKGKVMRTEEL